MLQPGSSAPAFALPDQNGRVVSSDALRGKWVVLYFYPKDDTPGCTVEACDFTAGLKRFEALDAKVYGVSADDAESHRKFIDKHQLKIDLLVDADHKVADAYGAWGEKSFAGKTSIGILRTTALIDPQGRIAAYWPKVKAEGHADAVAAKLAEVRGGPARGDARATAPSLAVRGGGGAKRGSKTAAPAKRGAGRGVKTQSKSARPAKAAPRAKSPTKAMKKTGPRRKSSGKATDRVRAKR
ncbi:MAG TPA: thioredoxin-dependent thiol peroxidase [Planctomycetota bacterium]|nr:thioredoxin-dependent thiol peroxidase [Planctomycetota bacterium]